MNTPPRALRPDSISEYRIEKVRRRVTIALDGGETLEGDVFLQPAARYRHGPQDPAELFNEPEPFLPLATPGDRSILIAKAQVRSVQFQDEDADTDLGGVAEAEVEVTFTDGTSTSGALRLETRADRPRLLDFLNDDHQRFLRLRLPSGPCLINRSKIAKVRERR